MVVAGFMTMPREVQIKLKLKLRGDWYVNIIQREWESAETSLEKPIGIANDVDQ